MSKKTTLQMTVGDESSASCCSQLAELPPRRSKGTCTGNVVVAEMPESRAKVQVDNRDPCRPRMVISVDDMSISMEQSSCSRATGARGASVTTLCVQTAKPGHCCRHHCPPKTIFETQLVMRK